MVAYSFKKRFEDPIKDGSKCQTIRGERSRHARVGEPIQLYTGMRTKACQRIMADPICTAVRPIMIQFANDHLISICILPNMSDWGDPLGLGPRWSEHVLESKLFDDFARKDGFADEADMAAFWASQNGVEIGQFIGVLIEWERAS